MKELFMDLLNTLVFRGEITAANLYRDSKYSTIEVKIDKDVYTVSIVKEEKKK